MTPITPKEVLPILRQARSALPSNGDFTDDLLAVLEAMVQEESLEKHGQNILSALGNLVSVTIRKKILLSQLEAQNYNLARVSDALKLGGTGNVLRMAKDLGLGPELDAARKDGRLTRTHKKPGKKKPAAFIGQPTPVLHGQDAQRLLASLVHHASPEEMEDRIAKSKEWLRTIYQPMMPSEKVVK